LAYQKNPAEDVVEKVLEKIIAEKAISGFIRNRPSDRLDEEGIDFLIFLNNGSALPLQVKTEGGKHNFQQKYREHQRKHPLVQFLICVPVHLLNSNPEEVYRQTEKELRRMLKI